MDERLRNKQKHCDRVWAQGLEAGREVLGNLQTNLEFLAQTDLLKPEDRILEVGCGTGAIVAELTRRGHDIIGTDISREAIEHGRRKHGNVHLEARPAEDLGFGDESFDVVLSFDLFEHIEEIDRHVAEVRRLLRPGGYYLFQTPNKYSNAPFETLRAKSLRWRQWHPSLHSPGQLRRRLRRHGFDVRFVKMNPINEFTLKKLESLGPLAWVLRRVDFRRLPMVLQTNMYVVATKQPRSDDQR